MTRAGFSPKKPYLTPQQQLSLLEDRGLIIENRSEAERQLLGVSFYSLVNTNRTLFCGSRERKNFLPGVTFDHLRNAYIAQKNFDSYVLRSILLVENTLKGNLSDLVAREFGIDVQKDCREPHQNYLYFKHYASSSNRRLNVCRSLTDEIERILKRRPNSISAFYQENYHHIPPWILSQDLSFGLTLEWYRILPTELKSELVSRLLFTGDRWFYRQFLHPAEAKEWCIKALEMLKDCRNELAHGEHPHSRTVIQLPLSSTRQLLSTPNFRVRPKDCDSLMTVLMVLQFLLFDDRLRDMMIDELEHQLLLFPEGSFGSLSYAQIIGLPENFLEHLKELNQTITQSSAQKTKTGKSPLPEN